MELDLILSSWLVSELQLFDLCDSLGEYFYAEGDWRHTFEPPHHKFHYQATFTPQDRQQLLPPLDSQCVMYYLASPMGASNCSGADFFFKELMGVKLHLENYHFGFLA